MSGCGPMARLDLRDGRSLRPLEEADVDELYALIERNRAELAHWMCWAAGQTREQTLEFIRAARASETGNEGLQRAIVTDEELIIGMVGCPAVDWANRSAAIGYWLDGAQRGHGIMTGAVAALADHAFEHWRLTRLEIRTDVENSASRAVAERLGFQYEGTARQAYRIDDDRYSDDAVYSLLRSDPRPRGAGSTGEAGPTPRV
jgi:ribosomal-protein-serine acetyltransferase